MTDVHSLDKVYVSEAGLRKELGMASVTVKALVAEIGPMSVMSFENKTLYNRAAVAAVLRKRHSRVFDFLDKLPKSE